MVHFIMKKKTHYSLIYCSLLCNKELSQQERWLFREVAYEIFKKLLRKFSKGSPKSHFKAFGLSPLFQHSCLIGRLEFKRELIPQDKTIFKGPVKTSEGDGWDDGRIHSPPLVLGCSLSLHLTPENCTTIVLI